MTNLTPAQVSESLNIPLSTLRRWADLYANHLSARPGKHRRYTLDDLNTFRRIQDYYRRGMTFHDIAAQLAIVETPPVDNTLANVADIAQALAAQRADVAQLRDIITAQAARIDALEAEQAAQAARPWYKRLLGR